MNIPPPNHYAFDPDEVYKADSSFENAVNLVKDLSEMFEELDLKTDILVIETSDGVFIRSQDFEWSTKLTELVNEPLADWPKLETIKTNEFDRITSSIRNPINSFGNEKIARWRMGF